MRARPWRGTLLFAGAAVAVAGATAVRYVETPPPPAAASATVSTSPSTTGTRTLVGDVEQIKYGAVQVAVTFSGSTITDVDTLRSPDGHARSIAINARATPLLDREAVVAGSAGIDTVSGATYTSEGYRRSLQSVLDRLG